MYSRLLPFSVFNKLSELISVLARKLLINFNIEEHTQWTNNVRLTDVACGWKYIFPAAAILSEPVAW